MLRAVICQGDPTSHGGKVLEGNQLITTNGRAVAQRGHMTICPQCKGSFPIAEWIERHTYAGIGTAVDGMQTAAPSASAAPIPIRSCCTGKLRPAMSDATCQLAASATVTTVPVCAKRTVCYEFDTSATNADLAIPYLVIINGKVQPGDKPKRLSRDNRKITATVDAGSKVALYLNSDVHPDHRRSPVYEVMVNNNNVMVKITEKKNVKDSEPPIVQPTAGSAEMPVVDRYTAKLTGDIWMTISHRYSEAEANALLPNDTGAVIRKAVCSIYRGLAASKLDIPLAEEGGMLHVSFINQTNPQANISRCTLLTDVLPRTHPCAYAALFSVARQAGLSEVHITSCWRPSLGSIVHRAGLGLDVDLIAHAGQPLAINRAGLRDRRSSRNTNMTDHEKELLSACDASTKTAKQNGANKTAKKAEEADCAAWENELKKNEPLLIRQVREGLRTHSAVKQILDPWYIDLNTRDAKSLSANAQRSGNEKLHKDHLHITIWEPKIYE